MSAGRKRSRSFGAGAAGVDWGGAVRGAVDAWGRYRPAVQAAGAAWQDFMSASGGKPPGVAKPPPVSALIKNTKLKSYLDKTYQKKCGVEVKRATNSASTFLAAAVGATSGLQQYFLFPANLLIPQGVTDSTRVGNSIEIKKMFLNMSVSLAQAGTPFTASVRFRFFLVKVGEVNPPGATPGAGQILTLPTTSLSTLTMKDEQSVPNSIIKEWDFTLHPLNTDGKDRFDIKFTYVPKGCHAIRWTDADTLGFQSNIFNGNIVLYCLWECQSLVPPPIGSVPLVSTYNEIDYIDI